MTQKHSKVLESPTSMYDFEGVHKNMEDSMGSKDKTLNLQRKLKGPQTGNLLLNIIHSTFQLRGSQVLETALCVSRTARS